MSRIKFIILFIIIINFYNFKCLSPGINKNSKIIFISDRNSQTEIFIMNIDGSEQTQITNNYPNFHPNYISFSPDGSKIISSNELLGCRDIYILNSDGLNLKNLTNNDNMNVTPTFSSDGKKIIFSSNNQICIMNINGDNKVILTEGTEPSMSPDGSKIVFSRDTGSPTGIFIMNSDGSNIKHIFNGLGSIHFPTFSPDGSKIAFADNQDGDSEIYIMNIDGRNIKQLTFNTYSDGEPYFSPDGNKIVFHSNRDGSFEIYIMNIDGSGQTQLTHFDNSISNKHPCFMGKAR